MGAGHGHALYVHEHSPVHHLPAEAKVLATFLFVLSVAITPREAILSFLAYLVLVVGLTIVSRIPFRFVLARLTAVTPFVLFAFLLPFIGEGTARVSIGGLSLSSEGLWAMWNILAKATLGAWTSILLTATTETPDILKGLTRLRVPSVITSIASFMIRYLEVIADELGRMRTAMTARGYDPRWLWQSRPIAASAGTLFIRSYERGERVYDAMLSRGYTGEMPAPAGRTTPSDWMRALALPAAGAIIAAVSFIVT